MNIVITGLNGFLSKNLHNYIKTKNKNIKIYNSSNKVKKNKNIFYFDLHSNFDKNFLLYKKINVIVHCSYSFKYFTLAEGLKKNLNITNKLFNFAQRNNIFIIYISSISSNKNAISNYGKIKFAIETKLHESNSAIIRPGLLYSNSEPGGIFGTIYKLISLLPVVPIINNGKNIQYMCKIESLCEIIYKVMVLRKSKKRIIFAFNQEKVTLKQIVNKIITKNSRVKFLIPVPSFIFIFTLKVIELFRINFRIKSDNLINFLDTKSNIDYEENEFTVIIPKFTIDYD